VGRVISGSGGGHIALCVETALDNATTADARGFDILAATERELTEPMTDAARLTMWLGLHVADGRIDPVTFCSKGWKP
jgi:hypothetical protein